MVCGEFGQVVDDARADGYRNGIRPGEDAVELLDETPFGIERRVGENMGFILSDSGRGEGPVHLLSGDAPRIGVGHDDGPASGEEFRKKLRHAREGSDSEHHGTGVGRALQCTFNLIHRSWFWLPFYIGRPSGSPVLRKFGPFGVRGGVSEVCSGSAPPSGPEGPHWFG